MRKFGLLIFALILGLVVPVRRTIGAPEFLVYSVYRGVFLGGPGEEAPPKDFYVNMGTQHGLRMGASLDVLRRVSTYDVVNEQFYRDMTFPIAVLKVIHVESTASIARLERMLPADQAPSISPRAVMVGDLVRVSELSSTEPPR